MDTPKLFDAEYKFMSIVWRNEPVNSTALVKLANAELGWKKSTTYTVIRKLSKRGVLKNENSIVSSLVAKEDVLQTESQELLDKKYNGSLKIFLVSFLEKETISEKEARELKRIIDEKTRKGAGS
jgi:predicted transcriptional regulator